MSGPSFAVVVPTIGREMLEGTLDSILAQELQQGDQVFVVRDSFGDLDDALGVRARVEAYAEKSNGIIQYREHDAGFHFYGVPQHNAVWREATADYLMSMGDDDIFCAGAWARLREAIGEEWQRAVLFQWLSPWRQILWRKREMTRSLVSGSCMAAPRYACCDIPEGRYVEVDFDWMQQIIANTGQEPLWVEDVVAIARPEKRGGKLTTHRPVKCVGCRRVIFREDAVDGQCILCRTPKREPRPIIASKEAKRIAFVWPAAEISVSDVARGYRDALARAGHAIFDFRLNNRFKYHAAALKEARQAGDDDLSYYLDLLSREATEGIASFVLRYDPDIVIITSGMSFHPDGLFYLKRLGVKTAVVFTESPYNDEQQRYFASVYTGMLCATNDKASAAVNGWLYLPPSYDASTHYPVPPSEEFACDVFMVGTGWPERQALLEKIDWTGVDLRLFGHWPTVTPVSPIYRYVRWTHEQESVYVNNATVGHAYASAKICLNIHRSADEGSSLNPRCLEVAACGGFLLTDERPGLREMFDGVEVPTFDGAEDLGKQIRRWLKDDVGRRRVAKKMRDKVIDETFDARARTLMQVLAPSQELQSASGGR